MDLLTKLASLKYQIIAAILVVVAVWFGAMAWHKAEVRTAVVTAVAEANRISEQNNIQAEKNLKEKAKEETAALQAKIKENDVNAKKQIKIANDKYASLSNWVRNQPSSSTSETSVSRSTSNPEDRSDDIIGGLSRRSAEDIIRIGKAASELQVGLVQCYADYDSVAQSLYEFKQKYDK